MLRHNQFSLGSTLALVLWLRSSGVARMSFRNEVLGSIFFTLWLKIDGCFWIVFATVASFKSRCCCNHASFGSILSSTLQQQRAGSRWIILRTSSSLKSRRFWNQSNFDSRLSLRWHPRGKVVAESFFQHQHHWDQDAFETNQLEAGRLEGGSSWREWMWMSLCPVLVPFLHVPTKGPLWGAIKAWGQLHAPDTRHVGYFNLAPLSPGSIYFKVLSVWGQLIIYAWVRH